MKESLEQLVERRRAIQEFVDRCRERGQEPVSEIEDLASLDMLIAIAKGARKP